MSDRLEELRRQRALLQQHLAWLDREIAAATGESPAAQPAPPQPAAASASPPTAAAAATTPSLAPDPDAILDQYRRSPDSLRTDVRRGCLLYFVAALGVLGLGVLVSYLLLGSH